MPLPNSIGNLYVCYNYDMYRRMGQRAPFIIIKTSLIIKYALSKGTIHINVLDNELVLHTIHYKTGKYVTDTNKQGSQ